MWLHSIAMQQGLQFADDGSVAIDFTKLSMTNWDWVIRIASTFDVAPIPPSTNRAEVSLCQLTVPMLPVVRPTEEPTPGHMTSDGVCRVAEQEHITGCDFEFASLESEADDAASSGCAAGQFDNPLRSWRASNALQTATRGCKK